LFHQGTVRELEFCSEWSQLFERTALSRSLRESDGLMALRAQKLSEVLTLGELGMRHAADQVFEHRRFRHPTNHQSRPTPIHQNGESVLAAGVSEYRDVGDLQPLGASAFSSSRWNTILIPAIAEIVSDYCFYGCKSLDTITFENE
jgi:hypothetical protein